MMSTSTSAENSSRNWEAVVLSEPLVIVFLFETNHKRLKRQLGLIRGVSYVIKFLKWALFRGSLEIATLFFIESQNEVARKIV